MCFEFFGIKVWYLYCPVFVTAIAPREGAGHSQDRRRPLSDSQLNGFSSVRLRPISTSAASNGRRVSTRANAYRPLRPQYPNA